MNVRVVRREDNEDMEDSLKISKENPNFYLNLNPQH